MRCFRRPHSGMIQTSGITEGWLGASNECIHQLLESTQLAAEGSPTAQLYETTIWLGKPYASANSAPRPVRIPTRDRGCTAFPAQIALSITSDISLMHIILSARLTREEEGKNEDRTAICYQFCRQRKCNSPKRLMCMGEIQSMPLSLCNASLGQLKMQKFERQFRHARFRSSQASSSCKWSRKRKKERETPSLVGKPKSNSRKSTTAQQEQRCTQRGNHRKMSCKSHPFHPRYPSDLIIHYFPARCAYDMQCPSWNRKVRFKKGTSHRSRVRPFWHPVRRANRCSIIQYKVGPSSLTPKHVIRQRPVMAGPLSSWIAGHTAVRGALHWHTEGIPTDAANSEPTRHHGALDWTAHPSDHVRTVTSPEPRRGSQTGRRSIGCRERRHCHTVQSSHWPLRWHGSWRAHASRLTSSHSEWIFGEAQTYSALDAIM